MGLGHAHLVEDEAAGDRRAQRELALDVVGGEAAQPLLDDEAADVLGRVAADLRPDDGEIRDVTSNDVNDYLREVSGEDITAKDFRTWHGTVLAAMLLQEFQSFDSHAAAKRNIRDAIQKVAARLGNTPTICRKCYIHPEVITTYVEGSLLLQVKDRVEDELRDDLASLSPEEAAVLTLLQYRLRLTLKDKLEASLAAEG